MRQKRVERPKKIMMGDYFLLNKLVPSFKEPEHLTKFLTERGKIISRVKSGLSSKNQRLLTLAVKNARHLAILPFVRKA